MSATPVIAIVIPCYKVTQHILNVLSRITLDCTHIYVIDDCCPDGSGQLVERSCTDSRVHVLYTSCNLGVGGAVMTGYRQAVKDGSDIIVKIDGDGQMNPELLSTFIAPIITGQADYTKGNRFYDLTYIRRMPFFRITGNAILSLMAKLSTGYWDIFDSTNGFTAIHADLVRRLPLDALSKRYFFETDMLFRLNTIRAVVMDIPMEAVYGHEVSNLRVIPILGEFTYKHLRNFAKRIFYNYFLRDFSIASLELVWGTILTIFGFSYGLYHWIESSHAGLATPAGTVMLSALPLLLGLELLLAFVSYDIAAIPKRCLSKCFSKKTNESFDASADKEGHTRLISYKEKCNNPIL